LNENIKKKDRIRLKHVLELCFQRKKVQLIESAVLGYKSRVNQDVDESTLYKWTCGMVKDIIYLQLFGGGTEAIFTDLLQEL